MIHMDRLLHPLGIAGTGKEMLGIGVLLLEQPFRLFLLVEHLECIVKLVYLLLRRIGRTLQ